MNQNHFFPHPCHTLFANHPIAWCQIISESGNVTKETRIDKWTLKERLIKHADGLLFYCNYLTDDFPVFPAVIMRTLIVPQYDKSYITTGTWNQHLYGGLQAFVSTRKQKQCYKKADLQTSVWTPCN